MLRPNDKSATLGQAMLGFRRCGFYTVGVDANVLGTPFATTHWSVVLATGAPNSEADAALETLCRTYWYPLYAYVRRAGHSPENAKDLTQEFFARLLAKNYLTLARPERGRFRTFLLASLKNFLTNEYHRQTSLKHGVQRTSGLARRPKRSKIFRPFCLTFL
jgi:RNA polymerase sigma-70 factor (ECF subfamily)